MANMNTFSSWDRRPNSYLKATTGYLTNDYDTTSLEPSESITSITSGLASGHQLYGSKTYVLSALIPRYPKCFDGL